MSGSGLTVAQWLGKVGIGYNSNDPLGPIYASIATNNNPAKAPSGNANFIEACLRYRGILYGQKQTGDCGSAVRQTPNSTMLASGGLRSAASVDPEPISGSILAGAAFLTGIFGAHHAQAVKTEQATLCDVTNKANAAIPQIDSMVASGQISAQDGISFMDNSMQQLIGECGKIRKDCNAACVISSALQAHIDFARYYYPRIGASGTTTGGAYNPLTQGLQSQVRLGIESPLQMIPSGAGSYIPLPAPPKASSSYLWLGVAAAFLVVILLIFGGKVA